MSVVLRRRCWVVFALAASTAAGCAGRERFEPRPTKGIGMMFNFPPLEEGAEAKKPAFFVRGANSISRHGETIEIPRGLDTVLYEGELVIVIGKRARRVSPEGAADCIRGYTCGMDGSPLVLDEKGERDVPRSLAGKSADGIAPVGPVLIERLRPEGHDIVLRINGKEVERANTRDFVWAPERIVSEISQTVTLEPGDVIFCGARKAVARMQPGDVVEVEIEGIGTLRNTVRAAGRPVPLPAPRPGLEARAAPHAGGGSRAPVTTRPGNAT